MTWVKIMSDMPLPMPRSVMSSPSHMMTAVPAVIVTTMTRKVPVLSLSSRLWSQPVEQPARAGQRHDARRLEDRQAQRQVAGYWILVWPDWPSFLRASSRGIATTRSWG